jgi:hypothetical protein
VINPTKTIQWLKGQTRTDNTVAKRTNNLQNITQKTKDRETQTPLKPGCELWYSEMVRSSTCNTRRHMARRH